MRLLVDAHCHLYEYSADQIERLLAKMPDLVIVAVSDDYESSVRTLELARRFKRIIPCAGLHPWEVGKRSNFEDEVSRIVELVERGEVRCVGEVGLDTKFVAETIEVQRAAFRSLLEGLRGSEGLLLNVHAAGTWEEVLSALQGFRGVAIIHWYTGPLHLLTAIRDSGFYISVNPAIKVQKKHQEVVRYAPLDILLTESDGPYQYRGLNLSPELIPEAIKVAAEVKGVSPEEVAEAVAANFERIARLLDLDAVAP